MDRPSDRAVEAEIAALEKKAKKSQKALDKLEEKFNEPSAAFYKKFQAGQYQDDEDRQKWAPTSMRPILQLLSPLKS
ncbi:MAG: hypothetical protein JRF21_11305 [Deltaproteobacteria bacterium]|nr:hypothetical protein [Deltaproteobacteria bacterium]